MSRMLLCPRDANPASIVILHDGAVMVGACLAVVEPVGKRAYRLTFHVSDLGHGELAVSRNLE